MSPEEWAQEIAELIKKAERDTGWDIDVIGGEIVLARWNEEDGRYDTVYIA